MNEEIILDRYKIDEFLGLNSYQEYFKGKDIKTNKDVLFRIIHISDFISSRITLSAEERTLLTEYLQDKLKDSFLDEVNLMKKNNFTGLPVFIDSVSNNNFYTIITEYRNGISLGKYLKEKSQLSESEVLSFLYKFLPIINHLHKQDPFVIYLYLNPFNIYIDSHNDVYLIKYNAIEKFVDIHIEDHFIITSRTYREPLFLRIGWHKGKLSPKFDMYSIGKIIFLMLTGKSPLDFFILPKISDIRKDVSPVWTQIVSRATYVNSKIIEKEDWKIDIDELLEGRYESIDELMADLKLIENSLTPRVS